jgi:tRNA(adenine34) deaminase
MSPAADTAAMPAAAQVAAMRLAIAQAVLAGESGEIPIGAVVLDAQGEVLAAAGNRREADHDPTAHAEVLALRAAATALGRWRLDDCTLVVTLEPCPMCAGAVVMSRLARVVFGAWNDEYGAAGSRWDLVRDRRLNHRAEVIGGILADECGAMVRDFLMTQRPVPEER